jgi:hypothetical protein
MGPKIILCENTAAAEIPTRGRVLVVCHKGYEPPLSAGGRVVDFESFKSSCRESVRNLDTLVLIGLNRIMTPGNRTEDVWELLFNQTPQLNKVSVDNTLFVSEPWRSWFHFGLVGAPYRDYTYSYIAESHYRAFVDGVRTDDPFSLDELLRWSSGVVASDHRRWFSLTVKTIPMSAAIHAEYAEKKRAAFDEETTVNPILRRLTAFAARCCTDRDVPDPIQLFRRRRHEIVATDLPIDRWLVCRLRHLAALVNGVAKGCHSWR